MKLTTNLGLKKPEGTDVVNIDDFNVNADKLDTEIQALKTGKANTSHTHSKSDVVGLSDVENRVSANETSILTLKENNARIGLNAECTLLNGWGIWQGGDIFLNTYIVGNFIKIQGLLTPGILSSGTPILKIASKYHPIKGEFFTIISNSGDTYNCDVSSSGIVSLQNTIPSGKAWFNINNSYGISR